MSGYCDWDGPSVYAESRHRARVQHICSETGRKIEPGEYYFSCRGVWDGSWSTFKQSRDAFYFCRWLNHHNGENPCVPFGGVDEHMNELRYYEGEQDYEVKVWDAIKDGRACMMEFDHPGDVWSSAA